VRAASPRRRRRNGSSGQALVEFALLVPVIMAFVLLTVDVGRAYYQTIDAAGAARAGSRMGIISDTSDIGTAVRDEPNTGIPNTLVAWGNTGPGTAQGTCTSATGVCGDPNGCAPSSFTGAQFACFAVRACTLTSGGDSGTCSSYGGWGLRPQDGGGAHGLQTVVVIKFQPITPALGLLIGSGNLLYLKQTATADELYY